ncbi:signal peptidase II [Candidatus Woesearchaeota archaeon]|nr:signal peptidase II [Candidatus Woesearchaeota archaeon]
MKHIIKKKFLLVFGTAFLVAVIDQISKVIVPNVVQNTGAAFGLFKNAGIFLIIISIIVILAVFYYYKKIPKKGFAPFLTGLILGGAVGNLIDRIAFGFVRDFIDLRIWPVFNIADACLTIGVIGLVVYLIRKK